MVIARDVPDLAKECEKAKRWVRSAGKSQKTQLVTRGHIISPPVSCECEQKDGLCLVRIGGQEGEVRFWCNRVVESKYRLNQLGFLVFGPDDVLLRKRFIARLPSSYQRILESFPAGSKFTSAELYAKVQKRKGGTQIHARRRWKELKYDFGFNVGYDRATGLYQRGNQTVPIHDPFPRPDDKKLRDDFLSIFAKEKGLASGERIFSCNFCGSPAVFPSTDGAESNEDELTLVDETGFSVDDEDYERFTVSPSASINTDEKVNSVREFRRGLLDHRRPIFQGGEDTKENLQVFCEVCNNQKSNICRSCPYQHKCDTCVWAFPERVRASRLVIILDPATRDALTRKFGGEVHQAAENAVRGLVRKATE